MEGDTGVTTPERFRRRQRIEGTILVVLGLFTVASTAYLDHQAKEQRACLVETVGALVDTIETGRSAANTEQSATRHLIGQALSGKLITESQVDAATTEYRESIARAKHKRKTSPLPPDPEKVCR